MYKNAPETELWIKENSNFQRKWDKFQIKAHSEKLITRFYAGDLVTRMGDQEIGVISERLPDNPGELLAHMLKNVLMDSRARANTSCGLSLW